ncbi:HNH endonuclease signature motif containing protein [Herbiconiux sp. SYSU D00978]|uniref:HNH endonuclease signature motif containing protein n=1 Tax=Herbiconiux sp. SYSU D00978 TaxID=2812562 RepID=UPI001A95716E|nr:HNH endonuclease signature motif containing protein [Herbiconiux sp. SYSU D00978]
MTTETPLAAATPSGSVAERLDARRLERERLVAELVEADAAVARAEARRLDVIRRLRRNGEQLTVADDIRGVHFRPSSELTLRSDRAEVSAALRVTERQAELWITLAEALTDLPVTAEALAGGAISSRHAAEIASATSALEPSPREQIEARAVELASSLTPRRLARRLRELTDRVDESAAIERHRAASDERGVWVDPGQDGMAYLTALLPAVDATAILDGLDTGAARLRDEGDGRSVNQLRADIFAGALLADHVGGADGARLTGIRPTVHITVPVLTLLGHSHEPAVLDGYGPIDAATARRLTAEAPTFQRLLTHPVTGAVLAMDRSSYRPPEELRRWLRVRDETCRFPTCGRAARRCEVDHCRDWAANGATDHDNLAHLCKGHHDLKHQSGWRYRHLDDRGRLEWTAPSGRRYVSQPARTMGSASPGAAEAGTPPGAAEAGTPPGDAGAWLSATASTADTDHPSGSVGFASSATAQMLAQVDEELLDYLDGSDFDDADLEHWDDEWRALWWANEELKDELREMVRLME